MTRKDQIRNAYRATGGQAGFYDGMMTCSTWLGKALFAWIALIIGR